MATQQNIPQRPARQPQKPAQRAPQAQRSVPRPQQRTRITRETKGMVRPFEMPFESKNLMIIIGGILTVALGYLIMAESPTMSTGALTIAPIILVLGYCVIIPYGIMYGARAYIKQKRETVVETNESTVTTTVL